MNDNAELRRLAEAATPGPWENGKPSDAIIAQGDPTVPLDPSTEAYYGGPTLVAESIATNNRAFIVAANPARVIVLLDRLAAADSLLRDHERECVNGGPETCYTCRRSNDWRMRGEIR